MTPSEAIKILKTDPIYSKDATLQGITKLFEEMRSSMSALFEVASGEYHGNEGNEENEIDEILSESAVFVEKEYKRLVDLSDDLD